ncbi:MAG: DUF4430 domain-containing protein [Clostridia bacterium]|nr:DUF4430 domain-containing protein [Clostridia bacterium]
MRKNDFSKIIKLSVIFVLIAAMALCMFSCDGKKDDVVDSKINTSTEGGSAELPETNEAEGKYTISISVIDDKGDTEVFEIKTDKETLADALLEAKLVEGEMSTYGLYIKVVNGIRADYDLDGAYWSLSKGGEMLMTGASETTIADGDSFELTYTKG